MSIAKHITIAFKIKKGDNYLLSRKKKGKKEAKKYKNEAKKIKSLILTGSNREKIMLI